MNSLFAVLIAELKPGIHSGPQLVTNGFPLCEIGLIPTSSGNAQAGPISKNGLPSLRWHDLPLPPLSATLGTLPLKP
jgi:hypothetical protein